MSQISGTNSVEKHAIIPDSVWTVRQCVSEDNEVTFQPSADRHQQLNMQSECKTVLGDLQEMIEWF